MSKSPSINSSLFEDPDEEAIEKHKDFRKIGAPKYGRLRLHRLSRIYGDPRVEEALKYPPHHEKMDIVEDNKDEPEEKCLPMHNQLTEIETVAIATVLESFVDILNILSFTNDKPKVEANVTYFTLEERFGELQKDEAVVDPDKETSYSDSKTELYRHIQKERGALEVTLQTTIEDLVFLGNYGSLEEFVIYKMFVTYEEDQLELQLALNEESITDCKAKLNKQRYFAEKLAEELERKVARAKDKMYDVGITNDIRHRYITKWEKVRGQQHHYALVLQEEHLKKRVEELKIGVDHEIHANHQIISFLTMDIEHLTEDVKEWTEKSFEDLEEIDLQTQKEKTVLNYVCKEVEEAQEVLKERHYKIVSTLVRRILPLHSFIFQSRRERSAIKIQKWWRSILQARQLQAARRKQGKKGMKKKYNLPPLLNFQ